MFKNFKKLIIATLAATLCFAGCAQSSNKNKKIRLSTRPPVQTKVDGTDETNTGGDGKGGGSIITGQTEDQKKAALAYDQAHQQFEGGTIINLPNLVSGTYTLEVAATELALIQGNEPFNLLTVFDSTAIGAKATVFQKGALTTSDQLDALTNMNIGKSFALTVSDKDITVDSATAEFLSMNMHADLSKPNNITTSDALSAKGNKLSTVDYLTRSDMSLTGENIAAGAEITTALNKNSSLSLMKLADDRILVRVSIDLKQGQMFRSILLIYKVAAKAVVEESSQTAPPANEEDDGVVTM